MSAIAFHEKAGRSQVDSSLAPLNKVFVSRQVASVAMLPSALSRSSQVQSNGQFLRNIAALRGCSGVAFFIAGLLFICAPSTSITWERTPHPVRRPAFSFHLIPTVDIQERRLFGRRWFYER